MGHDPQLTVLGSGTTIPGRRGTSCYLVEDGAGTVLLVDLGPGALHRAAAAGADLRRLDAILVTHVHPDHCTDLVTLQFALHSRVPVRAGRPPLVVLAHPEVRLLVARLRNAWPRWLAPQPGRMRLVDVASPGAVEVPGGTRVEAFRVAHHRSSWGWRLVLPHGFVVAFSGDTEEGGDLLALGREADLFVLEAAAPDERPAQGHLTPRAAGRVAAACGARRLLLTHFYPAVERVDAAGRAREAFEGRVDLAHDGLIVPLRS